MFRGLAISLTEEVCATSRPAEPAIRHGTFHRALPCVPLVNPRSSHSPLTPPPRRRGRRRRSAPPTQQTGVAVYDLRDAMIPTWVQRPFCTCPSTGLAVLCRTAVQCAVASLRSSYSPIRVLLVERRGCANADLTSSPDENGPARLGKGIRCEVGFWLAPVCVAGGCFEPSRTTSNKPPAAFALLRLAAPVLFANGQRPRSFLCQLRSRLALVHSYALL